MTTSSAVELAALEYAAHGDPVFPVWHAEDDRCGCRAFDCQSPAKHPIASLTPEGLKNATTDPVVIGAWWKRFPQANVAMRTGVTGTVLDVDPGKGGRESLAALEAQYGPLPVTPRILTGGGGIHYHFARVPGLRNSAGKLGAGLDIRGEDGYVLLPPSTHVSGGVYLDDLLAPMYETPRAPMPAWLIALATAAPIGSTRNGGDDWAALLAGAPHGQRHDVATRIAGHYLGKRLPPAEVETILRGYADRCAPPMPPVEVRRIVRDLAAKDARHLSTMPTTDDLGLISLGELLGEPTESHKWVVEGRLPAGGLGGIFAKPKAGKSTLARCLALHVARGEPWLGFGTTRGPVICLELEEKRQEVREHFRALGATSADPIYVLCATAPVDGLERLRREVERRRPALIIIDPLF